MLISVKMYKWSLNPVMKCALWELLFNDSVLKLDDKLVSELYNIPLRTLRRYVLEYGNGNLCGIRWLKVGNKVYVPKLILKYNKCLCVNMICEEDYLKKINLSLAKCVGLLGGISPP